MFYHDTIRNFSTQIGAFTKPLTAARGATPQVSSNRAVPGLAGPNGSNLHFSVLSSAPDITKMFGGIPYCQRLFFICSINFAHTYIYIYTYK